jgi:hypothetical protein
MVLNNSREIAEKFAGITASTYIDYYLVFASQHLFPKFLMAA